MSEPNFAAYYADLSESELVRIGLAYDSLVDEAQTAIRAEFARRGLEAPLIEGDGFEGRTLVTVSRYRDLSEAIVARSMLESNGIDVLKITPSHLRVLQQGIRNGTIFPAMVLIIGGEESSLDFIADGRAEPVTL